jgi:thiol:disulfide interchange protein DsbC
MKSVLIGLGMFLTLSSIAYGADFEAVEERISSLVPDMSQVAISETPLTGVLQVRIGGDIVYMSQDGRYLMQGRLIDMDTQVDLTDQAMAGIRKQQLADLDSADFVTFGNGEADHEVLVFTDPDCGYCRRLHEQIDAYLESGIRVNYVAFPRAGIGSPTHEKMVSIWCADDRQEAMDIAKAGGNPDPATCENPVADQYALGKSVGVTGTPSILTFNGDLIPGYVPPEQLRERLQSLNGESDE